MSWNFFKVLDLTRCKWKSTRLRRTLVNNVFDENFALSSTRGENQTINPLKQCSFDIGEPFFLHVLRKPKLNSPQEERTDRHNFQFT